MSKKKSIQTSKGSLKLCVDEANSFYRISKELYDGDIENFIYYLNPYMVNISFACELYLKAIIMFNSKNKDEFITIHELDDLFENLTLDNKEIIKKQFKNKYDNACLCDFLRENKNAFINWRYEFEKEKVFGSIEYFYGFATILKNFVDDNIN